MSEYISLKCFLYRCGDREGNVAQCAALVDEGKWRVNECPEDVLDSIVDDVIRANWEERNCSNCALLCGYSSPACPTHGGIGAGVLKGIRTFCYHRSPAELGGKVINRRVLERWARFCATRVSILIMTSFNSVKRYVPVERVCLRADTTSRTAVNIVPRIYDAYSMTHEDLVKFSNQVHELSDSVKRQDLLESVCIRAATTSRLAVDIANHSEDEWLLVAQELWRLIAKWGTPTRKEAGQ